MGTTESTLYQDAPPPNHDRLHRPPNHNGPSRPRRPRPQGLPTITLKGMILGLPNSGKQTLLQRLEGKDPAQSSTEEPKEQITVPYKAPSTVWDVIHLQVQVTPMKAVCDFMVFLVNPRHEKKTCRAFLMKMVANCIQQQQGRPLCLCLLLNFRDLQGQNPKNERISLKDLEKWAKDLQEQHSKLVVTTGNTSLRNCYGLSTLHHFIYQCYLQRKQAELEQQLLQVQSHLKESRAAPKMTYEDFLKVLQQQSDPPGRVAPPSREPPLATRPAASKTNNESTPSIVTEKHQDGNHRRPVMPMPPHVDPKQSLDAFFADDDDEQDVTPVTSNVGGHDHQDDEDDDDDDYFYDEGGYRHTHGHVESDSSEEHDEATAAVQDDRLAQARETSVVDDEVDDERDARGERVDSFPTSKEAESTVEERGSNTDKVDDDAAENGWSDDDLDLDDDEPPYTRKDDIKKEDSPKDDAMKEDSEPETPAESGWDDDDDLDLDDDNDAKTDTAPLDESTGGQHADRIDEENGESECEEPTSTTEPEEPADSSESQTERTSDTTVRGDAVTSDNTEPTARSPADTTHEAEQAPQPVDTAADESKTAESATAPKASAPQHAPGDESSDDDDDFVVEDTAPSSHDSAPEPTAPPATTTAAQQEPPKSESTPGISAAALAAIAAAEREAQIMVQEQVEEPMPAKRPKKKKKDPDAKKKKKKKDKRKSDSSTGASSAL